MSSQSPPSPSSAKRLAALALTAVGALIMIGAVFADPIGISGGGDGFGWKQLIAAIAGLVLLLAGIAWLLRPIINDNADDSLN